MKIKVILTLLILLLVSELGAEHEEENGKVTMEKFMSKIPKCCEADKFSLAGSCKRGEGGDELNLLNCGSQVPSCDVVVLKGKLDNFELWGKSQLKYYADSSRTPRLYRNYKPGKYCLEEIISNGTSGDEMVLYACDCGISSEWSSLIDFIVYILQLILRWIIVFIIVLVCFAYLKIPQLQDPISNVVLIILTIIALGEFLKLCQYVAPSSPVITSGLNVFDFVHYSCMMNVALWLNNFGSYLWKLFLSHNNLNHCPSYCRSWYYPVFVFFGAPSLTFIMIFALSHLEVDLSEENEPLNEWNRILVAIFPIGLTTVVNLFFCGSTALLIKYGSACTDFKSEMRSYLKIYEFMSLALTLNWLLTLFLRLYDAGSWQFVTLFADALHAVLILYVCVLSRIGAGTHVREAPSSSPLPQFDYQYSMETFL